MHFHLNCSFVHEQFILNSYSVHASSVYVWHQRRGARRKPLTAHSISPLSRAAEERNRKNMKIGFWELVVIVVIVPPSILRGRSAALRACARPHRYRSGGTGERAIHAQRPRLWTVTRHRSPCPRATTTGTSPIKMNAGSRHVPSGTTRRTPRRSAATCAAAS